MLFFTEGEKGDCSIIQRSRGPEATDRRGRNPSARPLPWTVLSLSMRVIGGRQAQSMTLTVRSYRPN
ncbi:hypothetical protein AOLI_G00007530 [Acnodon oligacanthus]